MQRTSAWCRAAVVFGAMAGAVVACAAEPETIAGRPPGHAAPAVTVTGNHISGVRATVVTWKRTKDNARPPRPAVHVVVRFTAAGAFTLPGTDVELTVCAITTRRTVVMCDSVGSSVADTYAGARVRTDETWIAAPGGTRRVADVVLLPDQYTRNGVPRSADPKDGVDYTPPHFPLPGEKLR